jgi:BASS family bile acid:Na+ symporter
MRGMRLIGEFVFTLLWSISFTLTALFLVVRMLWVGLGVTPAELRESLSARGTLARVLLANVVAVPVLAMVLVATLPLGADTGLAILLLAAAPGGVDMLSRHSIPRRPGSPAALVFLLSAAAVMITPLIGLLIRQGGLPMAIPVGRLAAVSVLGLLLPLLTGLALRATSPLASPVLTRATAAVAAVLLAAATLSVLVSQGARGRGPAALDVLALAAFALGAAAIGWLAGGAEGASRPALARITAMRNVGVSLLIAIVGVPHGGVAVSVAVFVVVLIGLRALLALRDAVRRRRLAIDHPVASA